MSEFPADPILAEWAEMLEGLNWAAMVVDSNYNLVWLSDELLALSGEEDPAALGLGKHMAAAYFAPAWTARITDDSLVRLFREVVPMVIGDPELKQAVLENIPDEFRGLVESMEPEPMPNFFTSWFDYRFDAGEPYRVNFSAARVRDDDGRWLGAVFTFFMGVRPTLFVLLARGNQGMYERMANLVEPRRRQGAVLFADLEASGALSRQLPTVQYFRLIRAFATCVDEVVGRNQGIIGKHAGDGVSAFFLTDDLGSPSATARAAITAARQMQARVEDLEIPLSGEVDRCILNVGLHWGSGLFMGQLVPGGRLDVTALGDEVNECARIQESARGRSLLASKGLVEQLSDDDAAEVGIDLEKLVYTPLGEIEHVTEKARRDAGALPVTAL